MSREPIHILLTSFGPFPDVPVNRTQRLVEALGKLSDDRPDLILHTATLETVWDKAPAAVAALHARLSPRIAVHFGVAEDALGIELERAAYNFCDGSPDADGCMPDEGELMPGVGAQLQTRLALSDAIAALHRAGVTATISDDPGRYLCNAVYHRSLVEAARAPERTDALFVHVPAEPSVPGPGDVEILRGLRALIDWLAAEAHATA
ncbi:MAG: hypothetical protein AAFQ42_00480 [Pseudomonadota bacterium]